MKLSYELLKDMAEKNTYSPRSYDAFYELINHQWESRPKLDAYWVFRNHDFLYMLFVKDGSSKNFIGFAVIDNFVLDYFEILPSYRNKKYGTEIIKKMKKQGLIKKVSILPHTFNFWNKFFNKKNIIIEENIFSHFFNH